MSCLCTAHRSGVQTDPGVSAFPVWSGLIFLHLDANAVSISIKELLSNQLRLCQIVSGSSS